MYETFQKRHGLSDMKMSFRSTVEYQEITVPLNHFELFSKDCRPVYNGTRCAQGVERGLFRFVSSGLLKIGSPSGRGEEV